MLFNLYKSINEFFKNVTISIVTLGKLSISTAKIVKHPEQPLFKLNSFKNIWTDALISPHILSPDDSDVDKFLNFQYNKPLQVKWLPGEKDIYNLKGNKAYEDKNIVYSINNLGFRTYKRWGGSKLIHCYGCSATFGAGLPDEETWPWLLQDKLGVKETTVKNYGVCGGSNDLISRAIYTNLQTNIPDVVVCFFPEIYRMEYFSGTEKYPVISFCPRVFNKFRISKKIQNAYFELIDPYNSFFNFVKNFKFIELVCKQKGVKLIWHTWSPTLLNLDILKLRYYLGENLSCIIKDNKLYDIQQENNLYDLKYRARDGEHPGYQFNQILSKEFANLIQ